MAELWMCSSPLYLLLQIRDEWTQHCRRTWGIPRYLTSFAPLFPKVFCFLWQFFFFLPCLHAYIEGKLEGQESVGVCFRKMKCFSDKMAIKHIVVSHSQLCRETLLYSDIWIKIRKPLYCTFAVCCIHYKAALEAINVLETLSRHSLDH